MKLDPGAKIAGVLAPLFAIRGENDLGVGDTSALKEVVSWAAELGLGFVQMLPVNETGSDHSPYNAVSSVAIEPSTISLHPDHLPEVSRESHEFALAKAESWLAGPVCYAEGKALKMSLLADAFKVFLKLPAGSSRRRELRKFCQDESEWLEAYGFYKSLQDHLQLNEVFEFWPEEVRSLTSASSWLEGQPPAVRRWFANRRQFYCYIQFVAHGQWRAVRQEAARHGVALVGDVPVGVSRFSCDVWAEPHLFDLTRSSGAPPEKVFQADPFTEQWGQNWGFPLYDWFAMSKDNFRWWRRRLQSMRGIFDFIRVDHALGFFRIYSFPWRPERNAEFTGISPEAASAKTGGPLPGFMERDDSTPENREKNRRHGLTLFRILAEETGPHFLLAEDLGEVPPYVRPVLAELEIPGFKIPQWETEPDGSFTAGKDYPRLSISTYATHDHPPLRSQWEELCQRAPTSEAGRQELRHWCRFAGLKDDPLPTAWSAEVHAALMSALFQSNSWLVAYSINDLFATTDRFNVPGSVGGANWTARLAEPVKVWNRKWQLEIGLIRSTIENSRSDSGPARTTPSIP